MVDKEAENILEYLPRMTPNRYPKSEPNAWIFIDASGKLCILPRDGGYLTIDDEDLNVLDANLAPWCN